MSDTISRYRNVAAAFTDRVAAVPPEAWDNPSPCEGWTARDVVRHVVDVSTYFLGGAGRSVEDLPSVDEDPLGAWTAMRDAVGAALEDPDAANVERDTPLGRATFEQTIARFGVADLLIHTWDLARATGLDERLDAEEVSRLLRAMEPMDELMRTNGAFGPKVEVPEDADEQTRLIAFSGRRP